MNSKFKLHRKDQKLHFLIGQSINELVVDNADLSSNGPDVGFIKLPRRVCPNELMTM